jgi:hypothetical protein
MPPRRFTSSLLAYDLETMLQPATGSAEDLVAFAEIVAGRRILSQGNVAPLTSAEWANRWGRRPWADFAMVDQWPTGEVVPTSKRRGQTWQYTTEARGRITREMRERSGMRTAPLSFVFRERMTRKAAQLTHANL